MAKLIAQSWGKVVNPKGFPEIFRGELAPKKHTRGIHPPAGIDHMLLRTTDIFRIPSMGEFTVDFEGYFKIVRSDSDNADFKKATVYVNFVDLKLFGKHDVLGEIMVDLNPNIVSAGNTFPGRDGNEACAINVAARFHIERLGTVLFNKVPIQLANRNVLGIPTIGEGGLANVFSVPLYNFKNSNENLFGYVEEVKYHVMTYADRKTVESYQKAKSLKDFERLMGNHKIDTDIEIGY